MQAFQPAFSLSELRRQDFEFLSLILYNSMPVRPFGKGTSDVSC